MAVAFDRKVADQDSGTGSGLVPTDGTLVAGEFVVIWMACDNTAGTNLPTISALSYGGVSQTFSQVASHNATNTTASAATRGFILIVPSLNTTGASGTSFTATFSASPAKMVAIAAVFTGVSSTVSVAAVGTTSSFATLGSTPASGDLILALNSNESNAALTLNTTSPNTDTQPGGDGQAFTTGGGSTANVSVLASYTIANGVRNQVQTSTFPADGGSCIVALAPASSGTPISGSDTGSGVDAKSALTADVPGTETATGVDVRSALTATLSTAGDTATAVESGTVVVTVFVSGTDTGSAVESGAVTVPITGADTATAVDARLTLTVTTTGTDTGSAADSGSTTATLTSADTGSATESGSVTLGTANISGSDTGAGADAANVVAAHSRSDTGSFAESASVTTPPVALSVTEAVTATEDVSITATFYVLVMPTVAEFTKPPQHAVDRVGIRLALTLYRIDGTWHSGRNIRAEVLEEADLIYRGGYEHIVGDEVVRAELVAAGYGFEQRTEIIA